jgi:hypothetical protein
MKFEIEMPELLHDGVLKGHGFTACGKTHSNSSLVTGHDFSHAANGAE